MKKKKINHNLNRIKGRYPYTLEEIGELLEVHIRTVQGWVKAGLKVLDPHSKPFLVRGYKLKEFLQQRQNNRKKPLKLGEFYCTRCRVQRLSLADKIKIEHTTRKLGEKFHQVIVRGKCQVCGNSMCLLTSDRLANSYTRITSNSIKRPNTLTGCKVRRANTDIQGELEL